MNDLDYAYVAGFFDGEGSISIAKGDRSKFRPNPSPLWSLRVTISNQHLPVLQWMHKEFNGALFTQTSGKSGVYRLILQTKQAENFLQKIQPWVRVKKGQVELALTFQEIRASRSSRIRLTGEEIDLYDTIMLAMQNLNHKLGQDFLEKLGEFREGPTHTVRMRDNPEPSSLNGENVGEKVQRLTGEEPTNNPDTSAQPVRDEIVRPS